LFQKKSFLPHGARGIFGKRPVKEKGVKVFVGAVEGFCRGIQRCGFKKRVGWEKRTSAPGPKTNEKEHYGARESKKKNAKKEGPGLKKRRTAE